MTNEIAKRPVVDIAVILASDQLTEKEKKYISLASGVRVKDVNEIQLKNFCIDLYSLIYLNKGFAPLAPEKLAERGRLLANELSAYYTHTSVYDIKEAVNRGSLNMYGEVYHEHKEDYDAFNIARIMTWVSKYLFENLERTVALGKKNTLEGKMIDPPAKRVTPEENYNTAFDIYKRTGEILDMGNSVSRWLWNEKKIVCSKAHWGELMARAKYKLNKEYNDQRDRAVVKRQMDEARRISSVLKDLTENSIKYEAARLLLKEYFDKLISKQ